MSGFASAMRAQHPFFRSARLKVVDGAKAAAFYQEKLHFSLVSKTTTTHADASTTDVYALTTLDAHSRLAASHDATAVSAKGWLDTPGAGARAAGAVCVELVHDKLADGSDKHAEKFNNGNVEPTRGFGHLAVNVTEVGSDGGAAAGGTDGVCYPMQAAGVCFKKLPHEGNMKTLAFLYDEDDYWVEVVGRSADAATLPQFLAPAPPMNFSQVMLRIKDAKKSLAFYVDALGFTLVRSKHFEQWKFSLYFLAMLPDGETVEDDEKAVSLKKNVCIVVTLSCCN
jgi:lactoylglutathione lyase